MTIDTTQLSNLTKARLADIKELFRQADQIFSEIPVDEQDAILEMHHAEGSVNHAIRWGNQALAEIVPDGPNAEQMEALRDYALRHGRIWKDRLQADWSNGRDERDPKGSLLRQVRNEFGPAWLSGFDGMFPTSVQKPKM